MQRTYLHLLVHSSGQIILRKLRRQTATQDRAQRKSMYFFHQSVSICMVNTTQCFNTPLDRLVQWSLRSEVQLALLSAVRWVRHGCGRVAAQNHLQLLLPHSRPVE